MRAAALSAFWWHCAGREKLPPLASSVADEHATAERPQRATQRAFGIYGEISIDTPVKAISEAMVSAPRQSLWASRGLGFLASRRTFRAVTRSARGITAK